MVFWFERNFLQLIASDIFDAVEAGQAAVEKCEIRIDQVSDAQVLIDHRLKKLMRFVEHRLLHDDVEVAVQPRVRLGEIDQLEIEPFGCEVSNEVLAAVVSEHPLDLLFDHPGFCQLACGCLLKQLLVGHPVPQEVT